MHPVTVAADEFPLSASERVRRGGASLLAAALQASRADTLAMSHALELALGPELRVPQRPTLNPPLWELGHIGWFQAYWLMRNPQRHRGAAADPAVGRHPSFPADADSLYDSSRVPHASRWSLPLPDLATTREHLAQQLDATLALLASLPADDDDALYFFRLALLHEDMHHEAALYIARSLELTVADARWRQLPEVAPAGELAFDAGVHTLGLDGPGFVFDNERPAHTVVVPACRIDRRPVTWREFLPFVEEGGYEDTRWWCTQGRQWLAQAQEPLPRYLRRDGWAWQVRVAGAWQLLDQDLAAVHLSAYEARAWCRWAGRQLPTEAQWERAAVLEPAAFSWGQVWEWTASDFAPFTGFVTHPYKDYSAPWFDGRPVLRGASHLTQPRMRHLRYRNYFTPERNDVPTGFRSCVPG